MNNLFTFSFEDTSGIDLTTLQQTTIKLEPVTQALQQARTERYDSPYAFVQLPFDLVMHQTVLDIVHKKKTLDPTLVLVIGIGGSHLGATACYQACKNEKSPIKLAFVDTIEPDFIGTIYEEVTALLQAGKKVLLNIISKSGGTLETIINAELFIDLLKRYCPHHYHDYIVITTDYNSALWQYGQHNKIDCLAIPQQVGGRFSVLTPVGLFPLAMADVAINDLCHGARQITDLTLAPNDMNSSALITAALLFLHHQRGITIHDLFLFSPELEMLGKWYRQLFAESLGKEKDRHDATVRMGMLPTVSIGTTDLHSVGQLYLGGPFNRFTTFVTCNTYEHQYAMPAKLALGTLSIALTNKNCFAMLDAIFNGVIQVYKQQGRPFVTLTLPDKRASSIGQYMQYAMLYVAYLGYLFNLNTFDQPAVELYKTETKKILSRE